MSCESRTGAPPSSIRRHRSVRISAASSCRHELSMSWSGCGSRRTARSPTCACRTHRTASSSASREQRACSVTRPRVTTAGQSRRQRPFVTESKRVSAATVSRSRSARRMTSRGWSGWRRQRRVPRPCGDRSRNRSGRRKTFASLRTPDSASWRRPPASAHGSGLPQTCATSRSSRRVPYSA